jgi:hypothetical protein
VIVPLTRARYLEVRIMGLLNMTLKQMSFVTADDGT